MSEKHHIGDYDYEICVYSSASGQYQGVILVTAKDGIPYRPVVEIQTPAFFNASKAASIEADALANELIHTGAIAQLLPPNG